MHSERAVSGMSAGGQPLEVADDPALSEAVLVYLGVGVSAYPTRLSDALDERFGTDARGLRARVDELLSEAWLERSEWAQMTLAEATEHVRGRMRELHPELTDDAVSALAWNFSFNSK